MDRLPFKGAAEQSRVCSRQFRHPTLLSETIMHDSRENFNHVPLALHRACVDVEQHADYRLDVARNQT